MTDGVRNGLGLLCVAAIALVVGVAVIAAAGPDTGTEAFGVVLRSLALPIGVVGLGMLAYGLFKQRG